MLFRFDPFDTIDRKFQTPQSMLAMDAVRNGDTVFVYFDAPGLDAEDLNLTIEKNSVTVEASRRWVSTDSKTLTSERPQGTFRRQIQFGDQVDIDKLEATLDRGVLTLAVPVAEGSKPRTIEIATGSSTERQLETKSS